MDSLLSQLEALVRAGDVNQGKQVLSQLKIAMVEHAAPPEKACAALELGVLLSVSEGDLDAFGRNMAQLHPYYNDAAAASSSATSSVSPRKAHILGLNLMHLLVENRLSEFHSCLELLTEAEASNPLISFPVSLERQLAMGIYDEVLSKPIPDASYRFFMDHLLQTVRDSIADCMEVSYKQLAVQTVVKMMKFETVDELLEYIQSDRDDWILSPDNQEVTFQPAVQAQSAAQDIPSQQWIQQSLSYATELERIV